MLEINVTGQTRSDLGKKASKDIRKQGLIPCNIYGVKKERPSRGTLFHIYIRRAPQGYLHS